MMDIIKSSRKAALFGLVLLLTAAIVFAYGDNSHIDNDNIDHFADVDIDNGAGAESEIEPEPILEPIEEDPPVESEITEEPYEDYTYCSEDARCGECEECENYGRCEECIICEECGECMECGECEGCEPYEYVEEDIYDYFCFLSGRGSTFEAQQRRPVSIVINNDFRAQPTVGMGTADIIYEVLIEGGVTRFTMVVADFNSVPVFGSIRSARDYMVDLSQSHDAIFVHAGGTTSAYTELNGRGINRLDGVNAVRGMHFPETFYRDAARRATMALEHTMMASGTGISAGIRRAGYRTNHENNFVPPFRFHRNFTELPDADNVAHYIAVPFATNTIREFVFNPEDGLYYRRQFGAAHIDGATGEQLRFENVIVLFAEYVSLGGREGHLACRLVGTGTGFYITGGRFTTIRWSKDSRDGPLHLFNWDGSDLYLNPGRTFICVTPTTFTNRVTISAELRPIG